MLKLLFRVRHFTFILLALGLIFYGNHFVNFSKDEVRVYPNPNLKYFTLGYSNAVAGTLWLSFLQSPDYCESAEHIKAYNQGRNLDEILSYKIPPSRCHKGWAFQTLNTLTEIDPKFYPAYYLGGPMLAVAVDDRYGAKEIFDKGLKVFPKDWELNYRASYLYIVELQDAAKAAELVMTAYKNGGPAYLPSLASKLYTKSGQFELARGVLEEFIQNEPDYEHLDKAKEKLQEIKKSLQ